MYRKHPPVSGGKRTGTVRPGRASRPLQRYRRLHSRALCVCLAAVEGKERGSTAQIADAGAEKTWVYLCLSCVKLYSKSVTTTTSILPRRVENRLR